MGDTKSQYQKIINKSRKIFEDKNSDMALHGEF